jgi:rod shape-determining protein MreD
MKYVWRILIPLLFLGLQVLVLPIFLPGYILPNLILVCVVTYSLYFPTLYGFLTGIISGFFIDAAIGVPMGTSSLALLIIFYLAPVLARKLKFGGAVSEILTVAMGSIVWTVLVSASYRLLVGLVDYMNLLKSTAVIMAENILVGLLMVLVLQLLGNESERKRKLTAEV